MRTIPTDERMFWRIIFAFVCVLFVNVSAAQTAAPLTIVVPERWGDYATAIFMQQTFDIGGSNAKPNEKFSKDNEYLNAVFTGDSTLVVIDRSKIHFFDKRGHQMVVIGDKPGSGPTQFKGLQTVCSTRGDTLVAYDALNARVSILTGQGKIVRHFSSGNESYDQLSCFDDGTFLALRSVGAPNRHDNDALVRLRLDGSVVATIGTFKHHDTSVSLVRFVVLATGQEIYLAETGS